MTSLDFIYKQLDSATTGFVWAALQIPTGRHHVIPLPMFGDLPAARLVFHVYWYTNNVIQPALLSEPIQVNLTPEREDEDWQKITDRLDVIIVDFQSMCAALLVRLRMIRDDQFTELRETPWGRVTSHWILVYFYQFLLENTNTLLSMALYWDTYLEAEEKARWQRGQENDGG